MHAWMCETLDGPAALRWRERPTPRPAPDEVRMAIHAASLNFPDLLNMLGVLASQYVRGLVKPVIDEVIPLSSLADAYHRLENRQILGKLVMVPDELLDAS